MLAIVQAERIDRYNRQLSNGQFSDETQRRLNDSSGVPIFEARIQQDLHLVVGFLLLRSDSLSTPRQYQIDVVLDDDGEVCSI